MSLLPKTIRFRAIAAGAILSAVAIIYGGWWFYLADSAEEGLNRWVANHNTAGGQAETGTVSVSGFPFTVRLSLDAPMVGLADGLIWRGPPLSLAIEPLTPSQIALSAPGRHRITYDGIVHEFDAAHADAALDGRGAGTLTLSLSDITFPDGQAASITARIEKLVAGPIPAGMSSLSLDASVQGLILPEALVSPLYKKEPIDTQLKARLKGAPPETLTRGAFTRWRDQGGTIEIDSVDFDWPPLGLSGSATMALDKEMQPELAGTMSLRGLIEALDYVAAAELAQPEEIRTARLVLGILGRPGASGALEWNVPVAIQDGTLYLGPAPVASVPRLAW